MQQTNTLIVVVLILALGLGGGYFFWQNQKLSTELAVLKNSDLAKQAELLSLKLKTTEQSLSVAVKRTTELETDMNKIKPYVDATTAIERFFSAPFTQKGLADIDTKISVLQDTEVSNRWMTARATVDFANNGWGPHDFFQTVFLLNSRIKNLLP